MMIPTMKREMFFVSGETDVSGRTNLVLEYFFVMFTKCKNGLPIPA